MDGWAAELDLSFVRSGARTALQGRKHVGPLRVQRPFYPEGDAVCHVYVLHPPGGLVAGDRLQIRAEVARGAHALLTTPAAGKLYRSAHAERRAAQHQLFRVAERGVLEWLPQETIAFDGARSELSTRVELAGDARFVGWEVLCLGRPAAGERFTRGEVRPSLELVRDQRVVYVERGAYRAGSPVMEAAWGLAGQPVVGTLLWAAAGAGAQVDAAREVIAQYPLEAEARAAVSGWGDVLIARYLGPRAESARELFACIWSALRPALLGRTASAPRIWKT